LPVVHTVKVGFITFSSNRNGNQGAGYRNATRNAQFLQLLVAE
jgi:hypothetical protein